MPIWKGKENVDKYITLCLPDILHLCLPTGQLLQLLESPGQCMQGLVMRCRVLHCYGEVWCKVVLSYLKQVLVLFQFTKDVVILYNLDLLNPYWRKFLDTETSWIILTFRIANTIMKHLGRMHFFCFHSWIELNTYFLKLFMNAKLTQENRGKSHIYLFVCLFWLMPSVKHVRYIKCNEFRKLTKWTVWPKYW